jgi:hypothetical protein
MFIVGAGKQSQTDTQGTRDSAHPTPLSERKHAIHLSEKKSLEQSPQQTWARNNLQQPFLFYSAYLPFCTLTEGVLQALFDLIRRYWNFRGQ